MGMMLEVVMVMMVLIMAALPAMVMMKTGWVGNELELERENNLS